MKRADRSSSGNESGSGSRDDGRHAGVVGAARARRREDLAYAEVYSDPPGLAPLPEEEPLIAKSVAKRRNEFITVRHCARIALGELGVPPVPILKGDKGEPCWPDGVVGSLTHCTGYRGAVVGRSAAVRSVGIDAEPHDVLPHGVLDAITLDEERHEIAALPEGLHWDRILFCAKEATYKAWFPLTKRWLGFEDAHIVFDVDPGTASDRSVRLQDPDRPRGAVGSAADRAAGPLVGRARAGADRDRAMTAHRRHRRRRQAGRNDQSRRGRRAAVESFPPARWATPGRWTRWPPACW